MSRTMPCLVFDADTAASDQVVSGFEEALRRSNGRSGLRAEAAAIEAWYGRNAYSEFLLKHGCRPDPEQASTIGVLIGARVKATDGKMYPPQCTAERKALRIARQEAAAEAKDALEIHRPLLLSTFRWARKKEVC